MIIVSLEMFERITKRALQIAEEQFRRMVFDTHISAEAARIVHDRVVEEMADRYIERLAQRANENAANTR